MMVSPDWYKNELKKKTYKELLTEKDELLKEISDFETIMKSNNKSDLDFESDFCPSPDVVYQCNLLYLSKLCELMADKFNEEYESDSFDSE